MFGLLRGALTLLYYRVFQYNRVSALHDVAIVDESGRAICSNSKRQVVSSITQKYGQPLIHRWWISSWPTFTQQGQTHFVVVCRRKKKGKHLKSKKYISKREKKVENVKRLSSSRIIPGRLRVSASSIAICVTLPYITVKRIYEHPPKGLHCTNLPQLWTITSVLANFSVISPQPHTANVSLPCRVSARSGIRAENIDSERRYSKISM